MQLDSLTSSEVNAADVILADHLGDEGQLFCSDASGAAAQAQHIAFAVALGEAAEVTGKLLVGNFADFLVMIVGSLPGKFRQLPAQEIFINFGYGHDCSLLF